MEQCEKSGNKGCTEYRYFSVKSITHTVLYLVSDTKYILAKLKCKHLTLESFILHLIGRNFFHVIETIRKRILNDFKTVHSIVIKSLPKSIGTFIDVDLCYSR